MKLCMVNAFFYPYMGGTERRIYENGQRLAKKYDVHVFTSLLENTKPYEQRNGMEVHRVKTNMYRMPLIYPPPLAISRSARKELVLLDKKFDFDAFNLHGRWFPDFAYSVKYAKKKGKFSTLTLQNARPVGISPMISIIGLTFEHLYGIKILKTVDKIISASNATKEDISLYGIDKDKIEVIHNGVNTELFRPGDPILREKYADGFDNFLLFTGRLIKQKGLEYLIDAMPHILKEHPSTMLLICGKGKLETSLKDRVRKKGLEKNIIFEDFIEDPSELATLYQSADIYLQPSLWEVLPLSLMEALSSGLPLIASDAGGNAEVARDGVNGFVFKKADSKEIIEKLILVLDDKKLVKKMGKKSREIAVKEFDWDIIAEKTIEFYDRNMK